MITYDINVLIGADDSTKKAHVKCNDTGVNLRVFLKTRQQLSDVRYEDVAYTIPVNTTAVLKINKPDGHYVLQDGQASAESVFFALHPQAFTVIGMLTAEVSLYGEDGKRITSADFFIETTKECISDSSEESRTYIDIIAQQIQAVNEAEASAKASAETAVEASNSAYIDAGNAAKAANDASIAAVNAAASSRSADASAAAADEAAKKAEEYADNMPPIKKDENGGLVQTVERVERQSTAVDASAAFGSWNRVRKAYSFASGWGNQVDAEKSAAFGAYNLLQGNANFANGRCNEMRGYAGAALGQDNISYADNAMCFGESLIATVPGQVVVGRNNSPNDDAIFIVGNGDTTRRNAFTVLKDGRMTLGGSLSATKDYLHVLRVWNLYSMPSENISLTTGGTIYYKSGTLQVTSTSNAGGRRPQVNVGGGLYGSGDYKITVYQGKSYKFTFDIKNPECKVRYWLCATEDYTTGFSTTAEKNACVIFETNETIEIPKSNEWRTVTVEIPNCAHSGYLRLGICSNDTAKATFEIKNIRTMQEAPVYNYVSKDGSYSTTLYKIADLQSTAENVRDWLVNANTRFSYNISGMYSGTISPTLETQEQADASSFHDDQHNEIVLHKFGVYSGKTDVAVVCVTRIVPDKMDVMERGIYVSPYISIMDHYKWTDTVIR